MLFTSVEFCAFFILVIGIYFLIPASIRKIWLLIASYFFYMCWDIKYLFLLFGITCMSYLIGIYLDKIKKEKLKKLLVVLSIILVLALLGILKYYSFIIDSLNLILNSFKLHLNISFEANLLLPVGISYYTLQVIGYLIDVYKGSVKAEKNFLNYSLFIAFFPKLVSGPIEKSGEMLSQIKSIPKFEQCRVRDGLLTMLWGYFLKVVIADRASIIVNTVYGDINCYGGVYAIIASILFAFQLYCDFMGYSKIAVGTAKVIGFQLTDNFSTPYFSKSISEFWRRWHISLSLWLRDYLYIPLGGNRKGKVRKYFNLLIVFLVSGLWHGAEWSFVLWGGINGIYQIIEGMVKSIGLFKIKTFQNEIFNRIYNFCSILGTFFIVDFAWIFFRADNIGHAFMILRSIMTVHNGGILFDGSLYTLGLNCYQFSIMIIAIVILAIKEIAEYNGISIREKITASPIFFRWGTYYIMIFSIIILGIWGSAYNTSGFIYANF